MEQSVTRTMSFPGRLDADLRELASSQGVTVDQIVVALLSASPTLKEQIKEFDVKIRCEYSVSVRACNIESVMEQVKSQLLDGNGKPFSVDWQELWSDLEITEKLILLRK